jgi:hypothetical protein
LFVISKGKVFKLQNLILNDALWLKNLAKEKLICVNPLIQEESAWVMIVSLFLKI